MVFTLLSLPLALIYVKKNTRLCIKYTRTKHLAKIGDIGGSAKKIGKRIKELERLYGIEHGNNQHTSLPNNSVSSQSDIAAKLGISVDTLQNYKMMAEIRKYIAQLGERKIALY